MDPALLNFTEDSKLLIIESLTLKLPGSGSETDGIYLHRDPGCLAYWRLYISISADFMKDLRIQQLVVDYLNGEHRIQGVEGSEWYSAESVGPSSSKRKLAKIKGNG